VLELDSGVGRILKTLKKFDLHQDTVVFFSSDNGAACVDSAFEDGSNGPFLCAKQTTFEGGVRVPGIVWGPKYVKAGQIFNQPASLMDIFTTSIKLAGLDIPTDRIIDGVDLTDVLSGKDTESNRAIFHYRGNELFAVRFGLYKAHYWTWTNSLEEYQQGITFCRGQTVVNVTTHTQMNRTHDPVLFHLGRDPGEKHPIRSDLYEYKHVINKINEITKQHKNNMKIGKPVLDWCDSSVMNWSPNGCQKIDKCLPIPPSDPKRCVWPH